MFPAEAVPEHIDAYQVLKHVGRSGAADVYTARMEGPLGFSRDVTLKLVSGALEEDARFAEELAREASICARLNHPVVVRMFDFFEYDARLVLVLEQVEGASLERLVSHLMRRKQKLGDAGIFYLASQLGAALAHAHASTDEDGNLSPVIHRDLTPENVLVGWDGNVRLAGFGLGKILGRTPDSIAGTIRGTPGYMSPEQTRGERATVRSDVYGFGTLIWSLLTGQEPPTDGQRLEPLSNLRPDLPRELHAAVDAALEPLPDKRRITCAEIAQWFTKLTKPEAGREELRQKVLWLRATRGPASKLDTTQKQARVPKRRQAIQATRSSARRPGGPGSTRPPSSYGPPSSRVPPSSKRPSNAAPGSIRVPSDSQRIPPPPSLPPPGQAPGRSIQARPLTARPPDGRDVPIPRSAYPTARPGAEGANSVVLRLPPPPALPNSARKTIPEAPTFGPPPTRVAAASPASTAPKGPTTGRPPMNVRTVSTAPGPRTTARRALTADEMYALGEPPPPWQSPSEEPHTLGRDESSTPLAGTVAVPLSGQHRKDPDTLRPARPAPVTFTLTTQLLLAGLTAALVVTVGILVGDRTRPTQAAQQPQVVTVEVNRSEDPARSAPVEARQEAIKEPTPEPAPVASAAPSASAKPTVDTTGGLPQMPDPSSLPETLGYLMVKGPPDTDVYLHGVRRGPTNEPLLVPCGQFFLRLAPKDSTGPYKAWLSPGQSISVECKSSTLISTKVKVTEPEHYRTARSPAKGVGL